MFKMVYVCAQELEFTVGDFDMARAFLQALGYQVSMIYEKYRAGYDWEGMHCGFGRAA